MSTVIGVGNALVDVLVRVDDETITKIGFPKGSMQLVDLDTSNSMLEILNGFPKSLAAGGSAANTINGLANLGIPSRFVGKIGNDHYGMAFEDDQVSNNIHPFLLKSDEPSGRAVAMISPDSERTFGTFLGAAMHLNAEDLGDEMFQGCSILHLEGYLVLNQNLIIRAAELAKKHGAKVSLDLASYNVVEANLEFLQHYIPQYVDILFANEEEAKAYTGLSPEESLNVFASQTELAIVKLGAKGSIVKRGSDQVRVGAIEVRPVDTTGAGDLYASGFLYGLLKGHNLETCARIGSLLGGKVIEVFGAKLSPEAWKELRIMI